MAKQNQTEQQLFRRACVLARQLNKAFGLEYFPSDRIWRCTLADEPNLAGCFWSHCSGHTRRVDAIRALISEMKAAEAAGKEGE